MRFSLSPKRLAGIFIVLILTAVILLSAWYTGFFFLKERMVSPDGTIRANIYERPYASKFEEENVSTTTVAFNDNLRGSTTNYPNTSYLNAWWSPDSQKFLIKMNTLSDDAIALELICLDSSRSIVLSVTVPFAMGNAGLNGAGFQTSGSNLPIVDLSPLKWNDDSSAIQFQYHFTDIEEAVHSGSFWYWYGSDLVGTITDIVPDNL